MDYLFQCAIGPVQEFIATARRSRDLWYGSWLLSELAKSAARAIADSGGQLIFPSTDDTDRDLTGKSKFNAPNKIAGVIIAAPEGVAKSADTAMRKRLQELRENAFKEPQRSPLFDQTLAKAQIDDLIEFYWVAVQFNGETEYAEARRKAEALLNARKATRDFNSVVGYARPKSSLDGARESVIEEKAYATQNDGSAEKLHKARILYERFRARPAERLSGVDILKRLGERSDEPDFRSTSYMAALPFLQHVDNNPKAGNHERMLAELKKLISEQGITPEEDEGDLLFTSRLADLIPDADSRKAVLSKIEDIFTKYAGRVRPKPYYALLAADGDNMGVAIDFLTAQPYPQRQHRNLSLALSTFAESVERIVKDNEGVLIYSGGDDVLAYLPLHTVLQCADKLADEFAVTLSAFKTEKGVSPTLSTGIVVAHHLEPLSDVLELVRNAERAAKNVAGKHALAITVSKRSGVDRTIKDKRADLSSRMQEMITWQRRGTISAGAAYELQNLDRRLSHSSVPKEAVTAEALRIIARKRGKDSQKEAAGNIEEKFKQWLKLDRKDILQELAFELITADFFADALDMAEGKSKEDNQ